MLLEPKGTRLKQRNEVLLVKRKSELLYPSKLVMKTLLPDQSIGDVNRFPTKKVYIGLSPKP